MQHWGSVVLSDPRALLGEGGTANWAERGLAACGGAHLEKTGLHGELRAPART